MKNYDATTPLNLNEAVSGPEGEEWKAAMN